MHKRRSELQIEVVSKIDKALGHKGNNFIGKGIVLAKMKYLASIVPEEDKVYFTTWYDYVVMLYDVFVPVEEHAVLFHDESLATIEVFKKYYEIHKCEALKASYEAIQFKVDSVPKDGFNGLRKVN